MGNISPISLWRRFLALPNTSRTKTLGVAFLVALGVGTGRLGHVRGAKAASAGAS